MEAFIRSVGAYAPPRRMSNHELAEFVDTSDEWIYSHTGISYRHIAAPDQAASDLAVHAAQRALSAGNLAADELDLVLVATSTPDYIGLPSTACVVQHAIGASHAGAMDVMAVCSGFVYALETARAFVKSGSARHVLVVGTEVYSKIMDWSDRNTCVLFGDGAGAVVVSPQTDNSNTSAVVDSILRSDGSGAEALSRPCGGTRCAYIPGQTPDSELALQMDGRKVYIFAVRAIVDTITEMLKRNNLTFSDIRYFVPHQANRRIIEAAAKRLGIPAERFYLNLDEYANTSAASIPLALDEMNAKGLLKRGDALMTIGFGAGLTYGANLVNW